MTRQPVLVFDPSPTGVNTAAKTEKHNLEFFPVGLAASAGVLQFSVPADPEEGSHSMMQRTSKLSPSSAMTWPLS